MSGIRALIKETSEGSPAPSTMRGHREPSPDHPGALTSDLQSPEL